jgi:outer membrane immunogenic protein
MYALLAGAPLTAASAADLWKAPPSAPAGYSWTGCYINGGVGYGIWEQPHFLFDSPGGTLESTTTNSAGEGWLGRVGAGCDYQASRFVFGVFGDYDLTALSGTFDDPASGWSDDEKEKGAWAVGGRIGYVVTPSLLTYFNGGYTQARFDQSNLVTAYSLPPLGAPTGVAIGAQTYSGWFLGGGAEFALSDFVPISGLFLRTEYRFAHYNPKNAQLVCVSAGSACAAVGSPEPFAYNIQNDVQTVTTGIVWRFNYGGR